MLHGNFFEKWPYWTHIFTLNQAVWCDTDNTVFLFETCQVWIQIGLPVIITRTLRDFRHWLKANAVEILLTIYLCV
jgi:hypothetical protein